MRLPNYASAVVIANRRKAGYEISICYLRLDKIYRSVMVINLRLTQRQLFSINSILSIRMSRLVVLWLRIVKSRISFPLLVRGEAMLPVPWRFAKRKTSVEPGSIRFQTMSNSFIVLHSIGTNNFKLDLESASSSSERTAPDRHLRAAKHFLPATTQPNNLLGSNYCYFYLNRKI